MKFYEQMKVFDDLTDNEWALVQTLFDEAGLLWKRAPSSTPCFAVWRQGELGPGCQPIYVAEHPPAPLREVAGRWNVR
jgi:hypothetical protein